MSYNEQLFFTPIKTEWKEITREKEIPLPQGNLPMMKYLTKEKQIKLIKNYYEIKPYSD